MNTRFPTPFPTPFQTPFSTPTKETNMNRKPLNQRNEDGGRPDDSGNRLKKVAWGLGIYLAFSVALFACKKEEPAATVAVGAGEAKSVSARQMADAIHMVLESDRTVYTRNVVNRLQNEEKVIKASEHWTDDKALPLPAQMFRMGAEMVAEKGSKWSYSLQSMWPINKQNSPKTAAEKEGLQYLVDNPGKNFYTEETLGEKMYFTAVYPDVAVAPACVKCHNEHKDTPRAADGLQNRRHDGRSRHPHSGGHVRRLVKRYATPSGAPLARMAAGPLAAIALLGACRSEPVPEASVRSKSETSVPSYLIPVTGDSALARGQAVWINTCRRCHAVGLAGAPVIGSESWKPRVAKHLDTLFSHALNGFDGPAGTQMPARGGNPDLSDDDVRAAVRFMIGFSPRNSD